MSNEVLQICSSGGVAYALMANHLSAGGVVYSVRYSADFRYGEWVRVDDSKELYPLLGSKYSYTKKVYPGFNLYRLVKSDLDSGKQVLLIGLPCDIAAVKHHIGGDCDELLSVDLICHGPALKKVSEDYLDGLESKFKSKIVNFTVRYKRDGRYQPIYLKAEFANGKRFIRPFYYTELGQAFLLAAKSSCYACKYKGVNHESDMTIGDIWPEFCDIDISSEYGASIVFTRTQKGENAIKGIAPECKIKEVDLIHALDMKKNMNENCFVRYENYERFVRNLHTIGLKKSLDKELRLSGRMKLQIKILLDKLPGGYDRNPVIQLLRRIWL